MCVSGIKGMVLRGKTECPYRCNVAMDFPELLRSYGHTAPIPVKEDTCDPQMRVYKGQTPQPIVERIPRGHHEPGFSTQEFCTNPTCSVHKQIFPNVSWDKAQLTHCFRTERNRMRCPGCNSVRSVWKLVFTDCHVQVGGAESFQGGEEKDFFLERSAKGCTLEITLDGKYLELKTSTFQHPRLEGFESMSDPEFKAVSGQQGTSPQCARPGGYSGWENTGLGGDGTSVHPVAGHPQDLLPRGGEDHSRGALPVQHTGGRGMVPQHTRQPQDLFPRGGNGPRAPGMPTNYSL